MGLVVLVSVKMTRDEGAVEETHDFWLSNGFVGWVFFSLSVVVYFQV